MSGVEELIENMRLPWWRRFRFLRSTCSLSVKNSNGIYVCKILTKKRKDGCRIKAAYDEYEIDDEDHCICLARNYQEKCNSNQ